MIGAVTHDAARVRDAARRRLLGPTRRVSIEAAVFAVACGARLTLILRHGGLLGSYGYDSSVYFAASDALVHGRMPYADFVLLHPPGLMLALTPFAMLTWFVSDPVAFAAAAVASCVVGALNAVLVVRVARRLGAGTGAAVAGGLFYALWFGSVGAEYLARLEPLGNLVLLLTLLALMRARERPSRRLDLVLGLCLGVLVNVKIWWLVPALALAVWRLTSRSSRASAVMLAVGVGLALAVVDGPFFVRSPGAMWSSIVTQQVGRQGNAQQPTLRLFDVSSFGSFDRSAAHPTQSVAVVAVAVAASFLAVRAWRSPVSRLVPVLFALQLAVILVGPSWFGFYADYLAVSAALLVGAAACRSSARGRGSFRVGAWLVVALSSVITIGSLAAGTSSVRPLPGAAALARSVSEVRCVTSDSPMGLIELNALSRGLRDGCRNWVDVTGRTYGVDRAPTSRYRNVRWQRDLVDYLRSGDAVVIVRARGDGLTPATWRAIREDGVLLHAGGQTVYRVRAGTTAHPGTTTRADMRDGSQERVMRRPR